MINSIEHKYSFTAAYEDGSIVEYDRTDPNGDTSTTKENGSRFSDVLANAEKSKLVSFVLHNDEESVGVDLRDGHFELNGRPFWQHRPDLDGYKDFRVIYYRTVQRVLNQESGEEISAQVSGYTVGWQVTHKGENVQRTVTV